jgi:hypothetical protein
MSCWCLQLDPHLCIQFCFKKGLEILFLGDYTIILKFEGTDQNQIGHQMNYIFFLSSVILPVRFPTNMGFVQHVNVKTREPF